MVLVSTMAVPILCFFQMKIFNNKKFKFHKLNVDKIGYYYPPNFFIFLSELGVKISNVEIHTFLGSGQFMETANSIGSP